MMRILALLVLIAASASEKPDRTVTLSAERFSFTPSRLTVPRGTDLELVITSEDTDHGFRLPAADIDATIPQAGKGELRVRFRANQPGRYEFYCSRPCGAGHNIMRGEIVVK
jgi:cytochrome c oxidase subunit 2